MQAFQQEGYTTITPSPPYLLHWSLMAVNKDQALTLILSDLSATFDTIDYKDLLRCLPNSAGICSVMPE